MERSGHARKSAEQQDTVAKRRRGRPQERAGEGAYQARQHEAETGHESARARGARRRRRPRIEAA